MIDDCHVFFFLLITNGPRRKIPFTRTLSYQCLSGIVAMEKYYVNRESSPDAVVGLVSSWSTWSISSVTSRTALPCSADPLLEGEPSQCSWDSDEPISASSYETRSAPLEYSIMPGIDLMQTMCGVSGFRMKRWQSFGGYILWWGKQDKHKFTWISSKQYWNFTEWYYSINLAFMRLCQ